MKSHPRLFSIQLTLLREYAQLVNGSNHFVLQVVKVDINQPKLHSLIARPWTHLLSLLVSP